MSKAYLTGLREAHRDVLASMEIITAIDAVYSYQSPYDEDELIEADGYKITTSKQEIYILILGEQQCCETYGSFCSNDEPDDFIGSELVNICTTNNALKTKVTSSKNLSSFDEGDCIFVNLETNKGVLQFAVYNEHNGYYGHDVRIQSNQLSYENTI